MAAGALHRAGVPILAGSDCGVPHVIPGLALHQELGLLVQAGPSPRQALTAATVSLARLLDLSATHGTIEVGKRADLVLLAADPLAAIRNTARISAVILGGPWSRATPSPDVDCRGPRRPLTQDHSRRDKRTAHC
jgi:imidazolonepropionase-like amidohydrolase